MRSLALGLAFVAAAAFADVPVDLPRLQADLGLYVTAATNGDDVVVAWESFTGYVRVARVRADGTVVDVPAKLVARGYHPVIGCGGGRCVVIFDFSGTVEAAVLSADLDVVRRVRFSNEIPDRPHTVAANDDGFLVTWQSNYYDSTGVLLTRDGDVSAQFAIHKCIVAGAGRGGEFAIAALPYMTGWPINTYRVARDGSLMAGPSISDDALPQAFLGTVALASSPNGFLVAYGGWRAGEGEGSVVELDAALQPRGPRSLLLNDVEYNGPPSAVWDGARYVVAFPKMFSYACTVAPLAGPAVVLNDAAEAALAVTSHGLFVAVQRRQHWSIEGYVMPSTSATAAPFTVAYEVAKQFLPEMATDGRSALLAWLEDERGWRVALLLPSGERRDVAFDRPAAASMSLAFDGRNYVMTWYESYPQPNAVYAQFVKPDGAPLGEPRLLGSGRHAIWNGTHFLVIDDVVPGTVAARVDDAPTIDLGVSGEQTMFLGGIPDGDDFVCVVGDTRDGFAQSVEVVRIRNGAIVERTTLLPADTTQVSIASNGDGFVLAWQSSSGTVAAALDRHLAPARAPFPLPFTWHLPSSVAWDGSAFLVAEEEHEDILSVRVTPSGEVSAPAVLADSSDEELTPLLVSWNGALVFAYVRRVTAPPMNASDRLFVRFPAPPPRRRASAP